MNTLADALDHPLTKERAIISPAESGSVADLMQVHLPMDKDRSAPRRQAPPLGHDTESVLAEIGLTSADIADILAPPRAPRKEK